jgi:PTH1 family peptidyl-tRNA hydrolase
VDRLADIYNIRESSFYVNHAFAETRYEGQRLMLCKPETYMNLSGEAVALLIAKHRLNLSELLVVYDEIQLPLGHLRLRKSGSDGGHNGLASIIEHLGSEEFPRLRCGVDFSSRGSDLAEYVLSPFPKNEIPPAIAMIERATEAIRAVMDVGIEKAMNIFNTPPTKLQDSL